MRDRWDTQDFSTVDRQRSLEPTCEEVADDGDGRGGQTGWRQKKRTCRRCQQITAIKTVWDGGHDPQARRHADTQIRRHGGTRGQAVVAAPPTAHPTVPRTQRRDTAGCKLLALIWRHLRPPVALRGFALGPLPHRCIWDQPPWPVLSCIPSRQQREKTRQDLLLFCNCC